MARINCIRIRKLLLEIILLYLHSEKKLGKWLMDIAKYVLTAVVVMSLISDQGNVR